MPSNQISPVGCDAELGSSLMIDSAPATVASAEDSAREKVEIIVLRASEEELLAHEQQVAAIDKASGGKCLWKSV